MMRKSDRLQGVNARSRKAVGLFGLLVATMLLALPLGALAQVKPGLGLILTPITSSIDAKAGKDSHETFTVRNTGSADLSNISISADSPGRGWAISVEPSQIGTLAPGAVNTVSVDIRPPSSVSRGNYQIMFIATAEGIQTNAFLQVRVQPASYWIWVVAGIAAVIIGVFVVVFVRAGRRG